MTHPSTSKWWEHLCDLAQNGAREGEHEAAAAFIAQAEAMTAAARHLIQPQAVSPAKARLQRYPVTPQRQADKRGIA